MLTIEYADAEGVSSVLSVDEGRRRDTGELAEPGVDGWKYRAREAASTDWFNLCGCP